MAWYPGATRMELQPESDDQPAIRPTQFIVHSIVAPWTPQRTYEYWRDSTNLESHFGLGYDGSLGQFIGTETRADANAAANRRADGTGAVSLESASNLQASDLWTAAQVEALIQLGVWLHEKHGIPLRICRSASDPGFGYHRLFDVWNPSAHSCPGDARVKQFKEVVFPGIVARATGKTTTPEEDPMAGITKQDIFDAVWKTDAIAAPADAADAKTNPTWAAQSILKDVQARVRALTVAEAGQSAAIAKLAQLVGSEVDTEQVVAAVQKAIADAVVKVSVDVTGPRAS
ncbi:N-acetylmuramoyl-L-alanine amidase [Streptomyces pseudovenezuelae]|uniref:N-acetylmuramoyl-L-alanine amidase n=1 Tax=Streptomyces pseudovenezuelae TaxID=67350 RepID=UPI00382749D4